MPKEFEILKSKEDVEQFRLWSKPNEDGKFLRTKELDRAEKEFALLMISLGHHIQHATPTQDKIDHWDWKVISIKTNKHSFVDVKGAKKEFRSDDKYDYNLSSNELQNVIGNIGWLRGKSHKIALVLVDLNLKEGFDPNAPNKILCFNTKELCKWTENKIKDKQITDENLRGVYYEPYQRSKWGREDICVKSKISDMKKDLKYTEYSLDNS
jgi:hypothetical protein